VAADSWQNPGIKYESDPNFPPGPGNPESGKHQTLSEENEAKKEEEEGGWRGTGMDPEEKRVTLGECGQ
jgi:hypothetical protein